MSTESSGSRYSEEWSQILADQPPEVKRIIGLLEVIRITDLDLRIAQTAAKRAGELKGSQDKIVDALRREQAQDPKAIATVRELLTEYAADLTRPVAPQVSELDMFLNEHLKTA